MTTSDKRETEGFSTKAKAISAFFVIAFILAIIFDADNGYKVRSSAKNYAKSNLNDSCSMIAYSRMPGFNRWDYDLEIYRAHLNGNVTQLLRHEKFSGDYIKCLYVKKGNKIEWNTATKSGVYTMPKGYSTESMQVNF